MIVRFETLGRAELYLNPDCIESIDAGNDDCWSVLVMASGANHPVTGNPRMVYTMLTGLGYTQDSMARRSR